MSVDRSISVLKIAPCVSKVRDESHCEQLEARLQEEDDGQDPVQVVESVDQNRPGVVPSFKIREISPKIQTINTLFNNYASNRKMTCNLQTIYTGTTTGSSPSDGKSYYIENKRSNRGSERLEKSNGKSWNKFYLASVEPNFDRKIVHKMLRPFDRNLKRK